MYLTVADNTATPHCGSGAGRFAHHGGYFSHATPIRFVIGHEYSR
jgi:hypothetical protein